MGFTPTSIPIQIHNTITALVHFDHVWPYVSNLNHLVLGYRQTIKEQNRQATTIETAVLSSLQHAIQQHVHSIYFYFHSQLIQLVKRTPPLIIYRDNYCPTRGGNGNQSNMLELTHEVLLRKRPRHPSAQSAHVDQQDALEELRLSYQPAGITTTPPPVPIDRFNNNNNNNLDENDKQTIESKNNNNRFQIMLELFSLPSPSLSLPQFFPA